MMPAMTPEPSSPANPPAALQLATLFALIYFVQGIAEPTEGLIAQPVRSLLTDWSWSASQISHFMAMLALPWAIKPLYGLLIDFVPLGRSRRRHYLLLSTGVTAVSLIGLSVAMPESHASRRLFCLLLIPTIGVAFSDVVADALMVEQGQPRNLTGRLQSVQWAAMCSAAVLSGWLGGRLSHTGNQELGLQICGAAAAVSCVIAAIWIRDSEPHRTAVGFRGRLDVLLATAADRRFLTVSAFLFLWNFNPWSSVIQELHLIRHAGLTREQYGLTISLFSLASIGACLVYGFLCRVIPVRWMVHLAIAGGAISTLAYLGVSDARSAMAVSVISGAFYMLGNLIQLDLAARICPAAVAGSYFALLMSVTNIALILATSLGGHLYENLSTVGTAASACRCLIWLGGAITASCWFLTPRLLEHQPIRER